MIATIAVSAILPACSGGGNSSGLSGTFAAGTFGALAQSGQSVFSQNCARCHGDQGQGGVGPTLIGKTNIPLAYPTADKLLNKISTTMPRNDPGSLSATQYQQVLSFIMLQNKWVNSQDTFNKDNLGQVNIE